MPKPASALPDARYVVDIGALRLALGGSDAHAVDLGAYFAAREHLDPKAVDVLEGLSQAVQQHIDLLSAAIQNPPKKPNKTPPPPPAAPARKTPGRKSTG